MMMTPKDMVRIGAFLEALEKLAFEHEVTLEQGTELVDVIPLKIDPKDKKRAYTRVKYIGHGIMFGQDVMDVEEPEC